MERTDLWNLPSCACWWEKKKEIDQSSFSFITGIMSDRLFAPISILCLETFMDSGQTKNLEIRYNIQPRHRSSSHFSNWSVL